MLKISNKSIYDTDKLLLDILGYTKGTRTNFLLIHGVIYISHKQTCTPWKIVARKWTPQKILPGGRTKFGVY